MTDRAEWLRERKQFVGASESPILVLGEHFGKTVRDLWLDKTSGVIDVTEYDSGPIAMGNIMEPIIRERYANTSGRRVEIDERTYIHPYHHCIGAHTDGIQYSGDHDGPGIIEIKNLIPSTFMETRRGLPAKYLVQMQHEMLCTGYTWGTFVFACSSGEYWAAPEYHDVPAMPEIQQAIVDRCVGFWTNYVITGIEPMATYIEHYGVIDELPVIGSGGGSDVIEVDQPEWDTLCDAHNDAVAKLEMKKGELKVAQAVVDESQKTLQKLLALEGKKRGAHISVALTKRHRIHWTFGAPQMRLNTKLLESTALFDASGNQVDVSKFKKATEPSQKFKIYKRRD